MKTRQLKQDDYALLKTATRRLIAAAGGVESAATVTRVNKSALSEYQNPQSVTHFMPVDVAADLEADTGVHFVTEALVRMAGGYMVGLTAVKSRTLFGRQLAKIGREIGHVFDRSCSALEDGKITDAEARKLTAEIDDAIRALAQARAILETEDC